MHEYLTHYTKHLTSIPINIGKIQSGEWPSSVPDLAIIEGIMGVAPIKRWKMLRKKCYKVYKHYPNKDKWLEEYPPAIEWFGGMWLPGSLESDHPLMNCLIRSFRDRNGRTWFIKASPWGTDGGILSNFFATQPLLFSDEV